MKAVGYTRTAVENGDFLSEQQAAIEKYAADHGLELAGMFSDVGSGTTLERSGLTDAMMQGDTLIVTGYDRVSRDLHNVEIVQQTHKIVVTE